jgi:hypothetical protein
MAESNQFCTLTPQNYPKWTSWQLIMSRVTPNWKWLHSYGGIEQIWAYKRAWISYNRLRILSAANLQQIPPLLLGCVAYNEAGGKPPSVKHHVVLPARQYLPGTGGPMATSEGAIKIQLASALSAMGYNGEPLTHAQQDDLTDCLETDIFNIDVVAKFLRQMVLFDYPGANTRTLTDEQFMVAGCRYNRGTARSLKDLQESISSPKGSLKRDWSSYGRTMIEHRAEVRKLLEI